MTVISFNFTKIRAEKKEAAKGKVSIDNNVSIINVEEKDLSIGANKQKALSFTFEFSCKYTPGLGSINLTGNVIYLEESKKSKEIMADWEKNKKLPKDMMAKILTVVLNKSNVQALILSNEVNLPSPVPLPKVQVENNKD